MEAGCRISRVMWPPHYCRLQTNKLTLVYKVSAPNTTGVFTVFVTAKVSDLAIALYASANHAFKTILQTILLQYSHTVTSINPDALRVHISLLICLCRHLQTSSSQHISVVSSHIFNST